MKLLALGVSLVLVALVLVAAALSSNPTHRVQADISLQHADTDGWECEAPSVPAEIEAQLQAICDTVSTNGHRGGFAVLFARPDAAGKTAAAEIIARELDRDLYRIDLSEVVSKYISETERNLQQMFDAAEGADAVLLFDEADELFGKRSEVEDSHDRYANLAIILEFAACWDPFGVLIFSVCCPEAVEDELAHRFADVVLFPETEDDSTAPSEKRD
jgi:hypothetical protein